MINTSEYSNSSARGHEDCGINHCMVSVLVSSLYFLIFIPALMLNVTVMWILLRLKTKSTFMVYLKNLVAADLLMTLIMPIKAANKLPGASLGLRAFTCRFANVLFYTSMYISIILMGLISLDRFFKIVRPCSRELGQKLLFGRIVSIAAWTVLLGVDAVPNMVMTSETPQGSLHSPRICMTMKTQMGRNFHETVIHILSYLFWVILVQTMFCYTCIGWTVLQSYNNSGSTNTTRKHKTEVKVFIVLVVFLVCFAPYHIVRIPYTELQVKKEHSCKQESLKVAKDFTLWLSTTNVCLDPLIYFFLSRSFRKKLSDLAIVKRFSTTASAADETNEIT